MRMSSEGEDAGEVAGIDSNMPVETTLGDMVEAMVEVGERSEVGGGEIETDVVEELGWDTVDGHCWWVGRVR